MISDDENALRWQPVLGPGGTYCSPRCGGGCKKADYDRAVQAADDLCAIMGLGWSPRVWENLGWYYEVTCGVGRVSAHQSHFTAWLDMPGKQFIVHASDPMDAWGLVVQDARTFAMRISQALDEISSPILEPAK